MCKDKENLLKRARHKFISKGLSTKLYFDNPGSTLSNSYFGSMLCCDVIRQDGKTLVSSYCNQRWCLVCNRIRTAKLICEYFDQINKFSDPYFVTLTVQTVNSDGLAASMANMAVVWRRIADTARKKRTDFKGVRKAECTIRPGGMYHYHFHLVIEGRENAEWLINAWLQRMGARANVKAQDMRPADERSLKELFKYFTKLSTKDKNGMKVMFSPRRMDTIFQSMSGKRVFQPFGGLRAITEEIERITSQEYENLESGFHLWKWYSEDWVNELGECLTGYNPNEEFAEMLRSKASKEMLMV